MAQWTNSDGLVIRLGTTEAEVTRGGEVSVLGSDRVFEFVVDLANVASSSAVLEDTQEILIPKNFVVNEVEVFTETAATGTGATLNIGLIQQDLTTAISTTALLAAAPRTDWATAGSKFSYKIGTTGIGASVGAALANTGYLTAFYSTAAFTAGRIRVRVIGEVKRPSPSN